MRRDVSWIFAGSNATMGSEYFPSVNQGGTAAESNEFRSSLMELKMSSVEDDFLCFTQLEERSTCKDEDQTIPGGSTAVCGRG